MKRKLLEGVKIADFCWVWVGPMTTKTLADQGAKVLRIESKTRPGVWRVSPPFKDNVVGFNRGGVFNVINTGKMSVTLNLSNPKAVAIAKRFVAWADVVTNNFAGGAMQRMGLGYEELKKIKPDIIMLSAAMMGQTGPHTNMPGFGAHLTAISGFSHIAGWSDREPADLGHYTDFIAPRYNALAIMAALDYRRRTGKGVHLDMAQYEGCVNFLAPLVLDYTVNQRVATRMGNRSPYAAPHGAFRCPSVDRWCVIAVLTDEEWESFCKVMVQNSEDLFEHDPHLKERNYYPEIEHPEMGKYFTVAPPYRLSKAPHELRRAPLMGEHNEYAFKEILGMSDDEIADLIAEGVID